MTSAVPMAAMSSLLAGRGGSPGKLGRACKEHPAGSAPRSNPMLLSMVNQGLCASAAAGYKSCDYSLTEFKRRGLGLPMTADT